MKNSPEIVNAKYVGVLEIEGAGDEANAKLIAAAPEMLEAIQSAIAWIERSRKYGNDMRSSSDSCIKDAEQILKAALLKATP